MDDSKMQYKLLAKRPADLYKAFKCSSGWSKLGPDANERVLACFKQEQEEGHRFFLTLSPMKAFKFSFDEWTTEGIVATREKTAEVLLAKPVRGPLITVDLGAPVDGYLHYTFLYTFSGSLFSSRN